MAKAIEQHLTQDAFRLSGGTRRPPDSDAAPRGLIALRAQSIEDNVLRQSRQPYAPNAAPLWSKEDLAVYVASGDPAEAIRREAEEQETARRRVTSALAARILYAHYGKVLVLDGETLGCRDAESRLPGLYALHLAVRETYTRRLKRQAQKSAAGILPRNMGALLALFDPQKANRDLNALVRLGRIIHHVVSRRCPCHAPKPMHDELSEDYRDMIHADTAADIEKRRKAFLRKWHLKCRALASLGPSR